MSTGAAAMGLSLGQQWAQNPNLSYGGNNEHALFGKLDPIGNAITKVGGDPLNLYGNKDNPNALLFPSGMLGLPNLGADTLIPLQPYGAFQAPKLGGGYFNNMAATGAGPLFNPGIGAPARPAAKPAKGGR
ncbi:MAG TPA: hypothetical protein VGM16_09170 [Gammaproteobacteria bacterium]|jgi:hypothetical protein